MTETTINAKELPSHGCILYERDQIWLQWNDGTKYSCNLGKNDYIFLHGFDYRVLVLIIVGPRIVDPWYISKPVLSFLSMISWCCHQILNVSDFLIFRCFSRLRRVCSFRSLMTLIQEFETLNSQTDSKLWLRLNRLSCSAKFIY